MNKVVEFLVQLGNLPLKPASVQEDSKMSRTGLYFEFVPRNLHTGKLYTYGQDEGSVKNIDRVVRILEENMINFSQWSCCNGLFGLSNLCR